jgi:hypothetical protein
MIGAIVPYQSICRNDQWNVAENLSEIERFQILTLVIYCPYVDP